MADALRTVNLQRVFGHGTAAVQALVDVNLNIPEHRLVALKGRSGSGKTTLLNILGALDKPSSGKVFLGDIEMNTLSERERDEIRRTRIGFVFQSFALVPFMSAYENVEFALRTAGVPRKEWKERVDESLDLVGLTKRAKHRPYEMSGGEQQRCAIARAIAHRPSIILADEPTAELDSKMGLHVMDVFHSLVSSHNLTIVMTTHDVAIMEVADHVFALQNGCIEMEAAPEERVLG